MKGITLNHLRKTHYAVECFEKSLEFNPEDSACFYHKGTSLRELKEYDESLKCFQVRIYMIKICYLEFVTFFMNKKVYLDRQCGFHVSA